MNIQTLIANALNAEGAGVPVDWKTVCLQVVQSANEQIKELQSWRDDVFLAHPNVDLDIEASRKEAGDG